MNVDLTEDYTLISQNEIKNFVENNQETLTFLNAIKPHLKQHFPKTKFSLEVCDKLEWTTETKLLLNIHVSEKIFFNGMLNHLNNIYKEIEPLIEDNLCPIVLFHNWDNDNYDKLSKYSAINIIARIAYFNNDFDENNLREMTIREIPLTQQKSEIIQYCKSHIRPNFSDIVYDLQLDIFDVDRLIDEIKKEGINLNVQY